MKDHKQRTIGLGLFLFAMLLGSSFLWGTSSVSALETVGGAYFRDVSVNDWYAPYVDYLALQGVTQRQEFFRPLAPVNRAEAIKMILRARGIDNLDYRPSHKQYFCDVVPNDWFYPYVTYGVVREYIRGYDKPSCGMGMIFRPGGSITRAEVLKLLLTVFAVDLKDIDLNTLGGFSDVPRGQWFTPYVVGARQFGLINAASKFMPDRPISRAEFAKIVTLMMKLNSFQKQDNSLRPIAGEVSQVLRTQNNMAISAIVGAVDALQGTSGKIIAHGKQTVEDPSEGAYSLEVGFDGVYDLRDIAKPAFDGIVSTKRDAQGATLSMDFHVREIVYDLFFQVLALKAGSEEPDDVRWSELQELAKDTWYAYSEVFPFSSSRWPSQLLITFDERLPYFIFYVNKDNGSENGIRHLSLVSPSSFVRNFYHVLFAQQEGVVYVEDVALLDDLLEGMVLNGDVWIDEASGTLRKIELVVDAPLHMDSKKGRMKLEFDLAVERDASVKIEKPSSVH